MLNIISLGAGVQSSTMALMAAHGEITPMPTSAVFADTGWEPKAVYDWLAWLEKRLPFPVHRVEKSNIRTDLLSASDERRSRFAQIPFYTSSGGMGRRQCTKEYKLEPLWKEIRRQSGVSYGERMNERRINLYIGISTDEAVRMKPAQQKWLTHRWPLIEAGMSRGDCLAWMASKGYPQPPKSSCIGCPFHDDALWVRMKRDAPEEFADAVMVDKSIRNAHASRGIRDEQFMHRSRVPLDEVEFGNIENQTDMFGNECEGMCGV